MFERINVQGNKKLQKIIAIMEKDDEIQTYWKCQNITCIDRMHISDHGPTHMKIVAEGALKILRILNGYGFQTSVKKDYKMDYEDAEVIVFLASVMHDLGISVHRLDHHIFGGSIAMNLLDRYLEGMYSASERVIIKSEILHAIFSHEKGIKPLTIEAAVVRISDALDMTSGRSRISYEIGSMSIHAVSAMAIKDVDISRGTVEEPILIRIYMDDSAGVFQVNELLKSKIEGTPLEGKVKVMAEIQSKGKASKKFEI
jgi:uncharacterized protein